VTDWRAHTCGSPSLKIALEGKRTFEAAVRLNGEVRALLSNRELSCWHVDNFYFGGAGPTKQLLEARSDSEVRTCCERRVLSAVSLSAFSRSSSLVSICMLLFPVTWLACWFSMQEFDTCCGRIFSRTVAKRAEARDGHRKARYKYRSWTTAGVLKFVLLLLILMINTVTT